MTKHMKPMYPVIWIRRLKVKTDVSSVVNFDGVLRNLLDDDLSFMAIYPFPKRKNIFVISFDSAR